MLSPFVNFTLALFTNFSEVSTVSDGLFLSPTLFELNLATACAKITLIAIFLVHFQSFLTVKSMLAKPL
jgi:hypothetical protein